MPDTFAKLLCEHARVRPDRPAMRHKDLGIWHTWTWREMAEAIRAYAAGLRNLGLERGATVAVIGENRPAMYWTILAAQWLGAIPVPVYADAVADEMAYVLDHAEVGFAVVQDQEQVDKILTIQEQVPKLRVVLYDEPRGLRDYDHSRLHAVADIIEKGRKLLASDAQFAAAIDAERDRGSADDISIILYTSGTTGRSATRFWPICRWPGWATTISTMRSRWCRVSASPVLKAARRWKRTFRRSGRASTSHRRACSRRC
jgi:long-chain acyl-CoA synthetase